MKEIPNPKISILEDIEFKQKYTAVIRYDFFFIALVVFVVNRNLNKHTQLFPQRIQNKFMEIYVQRIK